MYREGTVTRRLYESRIKQEGNQIVAFLAYETLSSPIKHDDGHFFRESLASQCFGDLTDRNIEVFVNHDYSTAPIAKTSDGSAVISSTESGLVVRFELPEGEVLKNLRDRTLTSLSPGFKVTEERWPSKDYRVVESAELLELSLVDMAAYSGSCCALAPERRQHEEKPQSKNRYHGISRSVKIQRGSLFGGRR